MLWAGTVVFAELADSLVEAVREQEEAILGQLRTDAAAAQDKRREAQKLVDQAQAEEFRAWQMSQWVMTTADDATGTLGRPPAPELQRAPRQWRLPQGAFERPWHREKTPVRSAA